MKKIIVTAFLILLMFTILEISKTYGLFETKNNVVINEEVGKWSIKVNDKLINSSTGFVVDEFIMSESTKVNTGKFYPGGTVYFDLIIDSNNCDVSYRYDVIFDKNMLLGEQFKITSLYEINGEELIETSEGVYTGIVTLEEIQNGKINTIRVEMIWENDESYNYTDSLVGLQQAELKIPITLHIVQYLGEELEVYTK